MIRRIARYGDIQVREKGLRQAGDPPADRKPAERHRIGITARILRKRIRTALACRPFLLEEAEGNAGKTIGKAYADGESTGGNCRKAERR